MGGSVKRTPRFDHSSNTPRTSSVRKLKPVFGPIRWHSTDPSAGTTGARPLNPAPAVAGSRPVVDGATTTQRPRPAVSTSTMAWKSSFSTKNLRLRSWFGTQSVAKLRRRKGCESPRPPIIPTHAHTYPSPRARSTRPAGLGLYRRGEGKRPRPASWRAEIRSSRSGRRRNGPGFQSGRNLPHPPRGQSSEHGKHLGFLNAMK